MLFPNALPGQRLGERTIVVVRRHWFIFLRILIGGLGIASLPLVLGAMLEQSLPGLFDDPVILPALLVGFHISSLLIWMFFASAWVESYLDIWIVTTERIIDIRQRGLFNRTVSELPLERIQDITTTSSGVSATTLGYGTMIVATAEAKEHFGFADMSHPERVRELIFKLARDRQIQSPAAARI